MTQDRLRSWLESFEPALDHVAMPLKGVAVAGEHPVERLRRGGFERLYVRPQRGRPGANVMVAIQWPGRNGSGCNPRQNMVANPHRLLDLVDEYGIHPAVTRPEHDPKRSCAEAHSVTVYEPLIDVHRSFPIVQATTMA